MSRHCLLTVLMEKDVQFAFRVEAQLREQFVRICRDIDRPAGQVLREFMRTFVRQHIQTSLFDQSSEVPATQSEHKSEQPL
jgi:poly(A) polymerase Pap1